MAPSMALLARRGTVCRSCLLAYVKNISTTQRRGISQSFLQKTEEARVQWEKQAQEIKEGKRPNFWDMLEERGYVKDTAGYGEPPRLPRGRQWPI